MRVMLATDGSTHAIAATEWLKNSPLPASAELMVTAVAERRTAMLEISAAESERAATDRAWRVAEDARERLHGRWPTAAVRVVHGDPREQIPAVAEQWSADLVVIGARGLGAVKRLVLGSVSTAVVHAVHCAVLVVKDSHAGPIDTIILVAVDGSPDSLAAARFVGELDAVPRVRLLAVVEPPYVPRSAPGVVAPSLRAAASELVAERRAEQEHVLSQVATDLRRTAGSVTTAVVIGRPGEEIVKAANEPEVGLAVVGARGFGAIKRALLGSISEHVLHEAGCPVLIVKHGA
jgi:nucleotide-binding universal stress UspA family protein